jgi:hypothetical protein
MANVGFGRRVFYIQIIISGKDTSRIFLVLKVEIISTPVVEIISTPVVVVVAVEVVVVVGVVGGLYRSRSSSCSRRSIPQ